MSITQRAVLMEAYWDKQEEKKEEAPKKKPGFIRRHAGKIAAGAAIGAGALAMKKYGGGSLARGAMRTYGAVRRGASGAGAAAKSAAGKVGKAASTVGTAASEAYNKFKGRNQDRTARSENHDQQSRRMSPMESVGLIPIGNLRESKVQELLYRSGLRKRPEVAAPPPTRGQKAKKFVGDHKKKLLAASLMAAALAGGAGSKKYARGIDKTVGNFPPYEHDAVRYTKASKTQRGEGLGGLLYKTGKRLGA